MFSFLRPLGLYAALFCGLFMPLPLRGELPGNNDTLLAIALANVFLEKLLLLLGGASGATILYPAPNFLAYSENCYGLAAVYLFLRAITPNDIWAYYLFISTLFALSSFAVFKLATLFVKDPRFAFLAGLTYSLAGFTLGNIDDPNVVFIFFPVLSLYYLERGARERRPSFLATGVLLAGAQIWFGFYMFMFQFLAVALFVAVRFRELRSLLSARNTAVLAGAYALLALPLVAVYYNNHRHGEIKEPYQNSVIRKSTSLSWIHFGNVAPNGLIYSSERNRYLPDQVYDWSRVRTPAFTGFLFLLLAAVGFWSTRGKRTGLLLMLLAVFAPLSFGDHLPLFRFFIALPLGSYLRVPCRFHLLVLVSLSVYFALGAEWAVNRFLPRLQRGRLGLVALLALVYIAENVPFPIPGYEYRSLIEPPAAYRDFFRSEWPKRSIVLDLPSSCCFLPGDEPRMSERLWFYNRDILYMNWQAYHGQIILGGVSGYAPASRVAINDDLQRVPAPEALEKLRKVGVAYIVFHKKLVISPREDVFKDMKRSPNLRLVLDADDFAIFALKTATLPSSS